MNRLRLAIQKKGRLYQDSVELFKRCGLKFRINENALLTKVENLPIDLLFVRDDDIPALVFDRVCDGGIIGDNVLMEQSLAKPTKRYQRLLELGQSRCRLSIAIPQSNTFVEPQCLAGKRIATSYPLLLQRYLDENRISANILTIAGSVEIMPRLGMADAICDLVSTGRTLAENNLLEVDNIFDSQAVLIRADKDFDSEQVEIFNLLLNRIQGVQKARECKYIMFHAPKDKVIDICEYLPGVETPTIMPLDGAEDKVAVHVVSQEGAFWQTLEKMKSMGASSILVLPIEKMLE